MNTIISSLLLSLFFAVFLLIQIWIRKKFDFNLIKKGKTIEISSRTVIILFAIVAVIVAGISYFAMAWSGPEFLQIFYIVLFAVSLGIGVFFIFPAKSLWHRLFIGLGVALLLLWLVLVFPNAWLQNIYMAAALLWVAPFIFWLYLHMISG